MALIKDYFLKTEELKNKYGDKSVVLMQVGSFYEIYGIKNKGNIVGSCIRDITNICEIDIADKKQCIGKDNIVMAGFGTRDYILEKYLKKIQSHNYTVAVYDQQTEAGIITRTLSNIYSPGTYFSNDSVKISNNITCIWCQKSSKSIIIGISNIDIFTGKSSIFEYEEELIKHNTIFDELELFISIYNPSEIILIYDLNDNKYIDSLINFASIQTNCIHKIDLHNNENDDNENDDNENDNNENDNNNNNNNNNENITKAKKCKKQVYQKETLHYYFKDQNISEIYTTEVACQSFCYLLDFINQHNPNLLQKINVPIYENSGYRTVLGNHSLKQLNMVNSNEKNNSKFNSIEELLNLCITPMGKRRISYIITHPIHDSDKLIDEYAICDYILKKDKMKEIREELCIIKDLEKINRKFFLHTITPNEIYNLHRNLSVINDLYKTLIKDTKLKKYIQKFINDDISSICQHLQSEFIKFVCITKCKNICNLDFEENIIKKGVFESHDKKMETYVESYDKLTALEEYFDDVLKSKQKKSKTNKFVTIKETDKSGFSLQTTTIRAKILIDELIKQDSSTITYKSSYDQKNKEFTINNKLLQKTSYGNNNNSHIESYEIKELCKTIQMSKSIMIESLHNSYKNIIKQLSINSEKIDIIVNFVAIIDVIYNKAHVAKLYNYSKPEIDVSKDSAFFNVEGLRHPLIENLLHDETYVTNDLKMNNDNLGILLYGINAIGKSCLIKSIGICMIMAQTGFFVPCSKLNYKPYHHIFTRIIGNDNIFKGLSTFAVEMLELNNILKKCNENSLILGDELCSGTENDSAIGIILSGIEHLYSQKSNFIFATHIHEIVEYEEIKIKVKMSIKHMSVQYNKESDNLIYYRTLKEGPGDSMYGLEVCKYLHMPKYFLDYAHNIRNKYSNKKGILDYKLCRYNTDKIRGMCELCKEDISSETHHLNHQSKANKTSGFINSFHKDVNGNLMNVCEKCHLKLHKHKKGHKKTKTTEGFILEDLQ